MQRRYLIAAGTEQYDYLPPEFWLLSVPADLARMERLLCGRFGYERVLGDLSLNPGSHDLRQGISAWLTAPERTSDDVVVIYYSGHGDVRDKHHYLLCRDSDERNLAGTALPSGNLMLMAGQNSPVRHILVILDTCYAGDGVGDLSRIAAQICDVRSGFGAERSGLWFMAAARPREEAGETVFTESFERVVTSQRAGPLQPYLSLDATVDGVNAAFRRHGLRQRAYLGAQDVVSLPPFIGNADYDPAAPSGLDLLSRRALAAMRHEDEANHWDSRSRGVALATDPGWYFSGRVQVLRELIAWLGDPDADSRPRVVTGEPGSGKSAVLARIVMLSDDDGHRSVPRAGAAEGTLPPKGIVDVAVHCRNKTAADLLERLSTRLGLPAASTAGFIEELAERPRRRVAVIDAVDEASSPRDLVDGLLRPLIDSAARTGLRLLVAARRPTAKSLGLRRVLIDLDDPAYFRVDDVADHVRLVLLAENEPDVGTPYRGEPRTAATVARAVARRAGSSFLIARIVARSLVTADHMVDVTRRDWKLTFPATVGHAFDAYLERCGPDEDLVRAVLKPLAHAEGKGLPWEHLWAPLARALTPGLQVADEDIERVHRIAGEYIVESSSGDRSASGGAGGRTPTGNRSVYRLYHEALAEHLRAEPEPAGGLRARAASAGAAPERLAGTLIALTPMGADGRRDWFGAHPYIRAHLPTHAARTGLLASLVRDAGFLLAMDPARLLPALPGGGPPEVASAVAVYQGCVHHLRGAPPALAAAYLQLAARKHGDAELAGDAGHVCGEPPWSTLWARWQQGGAHRLVGRCQGRPTAMSVLRFQGRITAVVGDARGALQAFDLVGGRFREPLPAHGSAVTAVAVARAEGRVLLVSGGRDGLRVSELTTHGLAAAASEISPSHGSRLRRPGARSSIGCLAVCEAGDSTVVISGHGDGTVRFWSLTGTTLLERGRGRGRSRSAVRTLAVARRDGRPVAVSGHADGTVRTWRVDRGLLVRERSSGCAEGVNAVALAGPEGPIITGDADGLVRLWDLDLDEVGEPLAGHRFGVHALSASVSGGRAAIISAGADGALRARRRNGGEWDTGPPVRHRDGVRALSVADRADGRTVVVSAGGDFRVRAWDLEHLVARGAAGEPASGAVRSVVAATVGNSTVGNSTAGYRATVVAAGDDGSVTVLDAEHGTVLARAPDDHRLAVRAMAVVDGDDGLLVVSSGDDETLRTWAVGRSAVSTVPAGGVLTSLTAVPHRTAVLSGGEDGLVRLWGRGGRGPAGSALIRHEAPVTALAAAVVGGHAVIVSGGEDGELRLRRMRSARGSVFFAEHGSAVGSLCAVDAEGVAAVASGGDDGVVRLWELATGREIAPMMAGHQGRVTALASAGRGWGCPAGGIVSGGIVSGGRDGTVCVWSRDRAAPAVRPIEAGSPVTSLAALDGGLAVATEAGLLSLRFPG